VYWLSGLLGFVFVSLTLWDIFQTMVMPRTLSSAWRIAHHFYGISWSVLRAASRDEPRRERWTPLLTMYGPLSLFLLMGLWGAGLIVGFALLNLGVSGVANHLSFGEQIYLSGTTLLTLGMGDVRPEGIAGRVVTVSEAGVGFAGLTVIVSFLPVLNQAFAKREAETALLLARAGHPASAAGMLRRLVIPGGGGLLVEHLQRYEEWSAYLVENYTSYPMLAFFRSRHENQSWLAAMTVVLDGCALLQMGFKKRPDWAEAAKDQAELTFAMGCRVLVTLTTILGLDPASCYEERFQPDQLRSFVGALGSQGMELSLADESIEHLRRLRDLYEPLLFALSDKLALSIPPFVVTNRDHHPVTAEEAIEDAVDLL